MRVLVTGAAGKVGKATVPHLQAAGHSVTASDRFGRSFDRPDPGAAPHVTADLTDAGQVFSLVGGFTETEAGPKPGRFDAVVHAGAIPAPGRHAPHTVFGNNLMGLFHVVEACVRWQVPRVVNISSETAAGFLFAERPWYPAYLPVDEDLPDAPQDPYGLAKLLGEQVCAAAVRRSDLRCVSLRPTWVQDAGSYARNLGPSVADPEEPSLTGWSYIDAGDLAAAIRLAVECDLTGHEVFYIAADDTIGGRDLHASWRRAFPDSPTELRPVERPDASGISTGKARRLLGWRPEVSWADHLNPDGTPRARAVPAEGRA